MSFLRSVLIPFVVAVLVYYTLAPLLDTLVGETAEKAARLGRRVSSNSAQPTLENCADCTLAAKKTDEKDTATPACSGQTRCDNGSIRAVSAHVPTLCQTIVAVDSYPCLYPSAALIAYSVQEMRLVREFAFASTPRMNSPLPYSAVAAYGQVRRPEAAAHGPLDRPGKVGRV